MTKNDLMRVNMILLEWMMQNGYYTPADSNEPVKLLTEMTDYVEGLILGEIAPPAEGKVN